MAKGKKGKGPRMPRGMGGAMGGGMGNLLSQVQKLQEDMEKTQAALEEEELVDGTEYCRVLVGFELERLFLVCGVGEELDGALALFVSQRVGSGQSDGFADTGALDAYH